VSWLAVGLLLAIVLLMAAKPTGDDAAVLALATALPFAGLLVEAQEAPERGERRPAPDDAADDALARLPGRKRVLLRLARRDVCGCGFLPLAVGNVPRPPVPRAVHRRPALPGLPRPGAARRRLRRLRVPGPLRRLPGPRLRGDPLAEEPDCAYEPPGILAGAR
jgi:hypothetical protein